MAGVQTQPGSPIFKHKRNYQMRFSPRSRKLRCVVDTVPAISKAGSMSSTQTAAARPGGINPESQNLSVFNFASSSQDSGSPQRSTHQNGKAKKRSKKKEHDGKKVQRVTRTVQKQTEQSAKKKRLEAINQQWAISSEEKEEERSGAEGPRRSGRRVSFLNSAVTSDGTQQESGAELCPGTSATTEKLSGGRAAASDRTQPDESVPDSVEEHDKLGTKDQDPGVTPDKQPGVTPTKRRSRRGTVEVEKISSLETTPKRTRASSGRKRKLPGSPAVLNTPSPAKRRYDGSPGCPRLEPGDSPSVSSSAGRKSPSSRRASFGRASSGSPAVAKKNHKGETPLHLAAIKVQLPLNTSPASPHSLLSISTHLNYKTQFLETTVQIIRLFEL